VAPGKEEGAGAPQRGGLMCGGRVVVARRCSEVGGGGFSVVIDDATAALHLGVGERMVRGA
jgi:hypothetical protein